MRSIQTKFIVLILSCVIVSAVVIGGAGVINSKRVIDEDSAKIMNLFCSEKAEKMDAMLSRIEQSVTTLSTYALDQLEDLEKLKTDQNYMNRYTEDLESVAVNTASNTEGAIAVYVRYNPEFAAPTSGLFWSKNSLNGNFQKLVPTDFSNYSPEDVEHVGWYYIPVSNGKATWMDPYMNENINVRMISYVVPIYKNNETVGVVGMDINFDVVTESVAEMRIYNNGYAFLTDSQYQVLYHQDMNYGTPLEQVDKSLAEVKQELERKTSGNSLFTYQIHGEENRMAFRSLRNGMRIAVTAPVKEIDALKNRLILQIVIAGLAICAVSVWITIIVAGRLIRPLKELNIAAKKVAEGDFDVTLGHRTQDEIGTLAESFRVTVNQLRKYIDYINGLAYRDSLTGVKNKTAYQDAVKRLEEQMRVGRPEFAVVVLDLNNLKLVNDVYGHDFGDMLIIEACKVICMTFKRSPVYRIGGDEFVAILEQADLQNYQVLLERLEENIQKHNSSVGEENQISMARGIAIYDSETDLVFGNVFKRADEAMYQNKAMMKHETYHPEGM